MKRERLEQDIKTRVPSEVKRGLEMIARDRHLDLSDIVREALRSYLAKNHAGQMELMSNGEKAA